jgi:hypothetical protein
MNRGLFVLLDLRHLRSGTQVSVLIDLQESSTPKHSHWQGITLREIGAFELTVLALRIALYGKPCTRENKASNALLMNWIAQRVGI